MRSEGKSVSVNLSTPNKPYLRSRTEPKRNLQVLPVSRADNEMKAKLGIACAFLGFTLSANTIALSSARGQTGRRVPRADSIASFWQKFKAAAINSDKETLAALSRFPISRGYGMASIRTKAQFMRSYRDLFFNETNAAQCFPKVKPMIDRKRPNEFSVSCPFASDSSGGEPFVYTFTRTRAGWKLTSFENINE